MNYEHIFTFLQNWGETWANPKLKNFPTKKTFYDRKSLKFRMIGLIGICVDYVAHMPIMQIMWKFNKYILFNIYSHDINVCETYNYLKIMR